MASVFIFDCEDVARGMFQSIKTSQKRYKCNAKSGGEVSPRKSVAQSACPFDVTSRVSDFGNGEQSVYRRDG